MCAVPGSKKVLVLDYGNVKNAWQVSMVKEVAELHFAGMAESVVVGYCCNQVVFVSWGVCPKNFI